MKTITFQVRGKFYHFNVFALLLWVSGGGLNVFFGGKYAHIGTEIVIVAGVLLQVMTTQDAPATAVVKNAPSTSANGTVNGQKVATIPRTAQDIIDTPST